jgi:hypothetical protein
MPTLIAKRSTGAAIALAAVLGILIGCLLAWFVFSEHLPAHYPQAALAPIAAVLSVYVVIVALSLGRTEAPFAIQLSVAIVGALLTLVVGAVLIEMILCHYDRYACINL